MIDLTLQNGKIKRIRTVEQKAFNLLYTQKGSVMYSPNFGFDLQKFMEYGQEINFSNVQSEMNIYLLENQIKILEHTGLIENLEMKLKMLVTSNNIGENNAL